MKTPSSVIREELPFSSPPRIRVVSDPQHMTDAVALAEALEECGAEADVRFEEDATGTDYDHVHPDAYVIDHLYPSIPPKINGSVMVAISDDRSVEPRELIQKIGEHMRGGLPVA